MTYDTFLQLVKKLKCFIEVHPAIMSNIQNIKTNLLKKDDDLAAAKIYRYYMRYKNGSSTLDTLVLAIIVLRYPDKTFENCREDKIRLRYMKLNKNYVVKIRDYIKELEEFMYSY